MIPVTYKAVFEVRNDTYTTQANDPNATEWQVEVNLGSLMKGDKGDKGDAATVSVGSVSAVTGSSAQASVTNSGNQYDAELNFSFTLPKGDKGDTGDKGNTGDTGNGISSITGPVTSGLIDTYTINYTNGNSRTFQVKNGLDGTNGAAATIAVGTTSEGPANVVNVGTSNAAILNFTIPRGAKGETGNTGATGAAAGFDTPEATINSSVGTPGVTVTATGPDTNKKFTFAFTNLKGETGAQGPVGRGIEITGQVIGTWTPPANPQPGDAWYCTGDTLLHVYDGTGWFTVDLGAGTLTTTATTAQPTESAESLGGSVTLHKIAKTGTYSDLILPAGGIPYSDLAGDIPSSKLASGVQTSLGKADTALQSTDISTSVSTDASSDSKASSPKSVKTYVDDQISSMSTTVSGKATKVSSATSGNFAGLDGNGDLTDSGKKAADFANATHTHGNIQSDGTLQTNDVAIGNGDKLVIADYDGNNKIARASLSFDGSTTTKALTQKGTFETFLTSSDISGKEDKSNKKTSWSSTVSDTNYPSEKLVKDTIDTKATKVTGATNGNFAGLNSSGELTDSGSKASDFLTQHQSIKTINSTTITGTGNVNVGNIRCEDSPITIEKISVLSETAYTNLSTKVATTLYILIPDA